MADQLLPAFPGTMGPMVGDANTADATAQAAWMNQLRANAAATTANAAATGTAAAGGRRAADRGFGTQASQKIKGALLSPVGVGVLVIVAVFVLSMVLLAAIQPPFVMQPPASKLEAETLSGKRVAVGALVAAAVAGLCIGIAAIVAHSKKGKKAL